MGATIIPAGEGNNRIDGLGRSWMDEGRHLFVSNGVMHRCHDGICTSIDFMQVRWNFDGLRMMTKEKKKGVNSPGSPEKR